MQVTETLTEGLKREYRVVVPLADLSAKVDERLDDLKGRVQIRGFRPGPQHANAHGIVHGGMLATFLDSAMGSAVFHVLQRRCVTVRLSIDYLMPARLGDWLQAEAEVVGHDAQVAQVRGRLYGPRHDVLAGLGSFVLLSRRRQPKIRSQA